jgi:hypothetical protein
MLHAVMAVPRTPFRLGEIAHEREGTQAALAHL